MSGGHASAPGLTLCRGLPALGVFVAAALLLYACGASSPIVGARTRTGTRVVDDAEVHAGLPRIVASRGSVQALWEAPLAQARVVDGLVVGLVPGGGPARELRAVSELTGKTAWSTPMPAGYSDVLGLIAGDGLVVVEVGHDVGKAPAAVVPVVSHDLVFDAADGRELWSAPVEKSGAARLQHQPVALSHDLLITGDAAGRLTARNARSGATVWTRARPASCPRGRGAEHGYDETLAADGSLLAVSYQCHAAGHTFAEVRRVSPSTGRTLWQWDSVRVPDTPQSFVDLSVVAVAGRGDVVLLGGQVARAGRLAKLLPRPRRWPAILGPFGENELLVALDGNSGRPRWSEQGAQLETVSMSDAATCETVTVGFECRDDRTGLPSRPLVRTSRSEGGAPPYVDDGDAGIGGGVAGVVLSQAPSGATSIAVYPLRRAGTTARARVDLGRGVYGGANYRSFIVGAAPLPDGETLLLLRRVDVAGYPLVALRAILHGGS